jgi:CRP-like cAMP-binding protein
MKGIGVHFGPPKERVSLGRNRLLAELPSNDFALLEPHLVEKTFDPGTVLQQAGEPISRVYFPHSGIISLLGVLPNGDAVDTATIGREGGLGLSAGLGAQTAFCRAVVQSPSRVSYASALRFAAAAADSKAIREVIVRYGDTLLAQVQQTVVCNTVHHLQARLCRWLLHAHDRVEADTLALTQQFLSGLLGAQRTSITMISRLLQAEGIIDVRRGRIHIRDLNALERKACSCYRVMRSLTERNQPRAAEGFTPPELVNEPSIGIAPD